MNNRRRQLALGLLVSGGLLAVVLSQLELDAFRQRVAQADPIWLMAALGVSLLVLVARGLRFHALCLVAGRADVTAAIAVQNALTRITPLRLGELSLPLLLRRRADEAPAHVLISLVLVRLFELWVLLATALISGLAWFGLDGAGRTSAMVLGLVVMTAVLITFRFWLRVGLKTLRWFVAALNIESVGPIAKGIAALTSAASESGRLRTRGLLGLGFGTLVVVCLQFVLFGTLMAACGLYPHPLQLLVGAAAAQVAGALPVLSVGSLGTHETGWALGFVWVGLALDDAIVSGLFTQIATLVFAGLFAIPGWWALARPKKPKVAPHH